MKKNYVEPNILATTFKLEAGFAISYGAGTPGGEIGFGDYGEEL